MVPLLAARPIASTADFRRFGFPQPLPVNHLLCENCRTQGRIGEVGLRKAGAEPMADAGKVCGWQTRSGRLCQPDFRNNRRASGETRKHDNTAFQQIVPHYRDNGVDLLVGLGKPRTRTDPQPVALPPGASLAPRDAFHVVGPADGRMGTLHPDNDRELRTNTSPCPTHGARSADARSDAKAGRKVRTSSTVARPSSRAPLLRSTTVAHRRIRRRRRAVGGGIGSRNGKFESVSLQR